MFEFDDVARGFAAKNFDGRLVAQIVRPFDRVEHHVGPIVVLSNCRVDAAFGRARVATCGVKFGNDRNVDTRVERLDGGPHAGKSAADDQHVVRNWSGGSRARQ